MEYELKLSEQEINTLFEALEAWEKEVASSSAMSGIFRAMLFRGEDEQQVKQKLNEDMEQAHIKEMNRKRTSILLKAKLVQALDDCAAGELFHRAMQ